MQWLTGIAATLPGALIVGLALALRRARIDRGRLRRELTVQTKYDALTGLANRDALPAALAASAGPAGLLIVDLDGFRDVNDRLGHRAGDELLIQAAARLQAAARPDDLVTRLDGDEFALLTHDVEGLDDLAAACLAALIDPYPIGGTTVSLTASIGSYQTAGPVAAGDALTFADLALTAAKAAGRNRTVRYQPAMWMAHQVRARLADQLRVATAEAGFTLHYQPVVELATGRIRAVEALLRFTPPGGSPVSPADFVPVAEEIGLIGPIGAWVLERACIDALAWHDSHGLSVTVNVSGRQLRDPTFADGVLATLRRTGLPGRALVLEITETVLVTATSDETEAVSRKLARLRAHGIRIAIDDFGTGYSSLAYLRNLPVDVLKIDRTFVARAERGQELGPQDRALLRAVLDLAKGHYLEPVAEGVETPEQAAALRQLDCRLAQGFLFARPMAAAAIDALLASTPVAV